MRRAVVVAVLALAPGVAAVRAQTPQYRSPAGVAYYAQRDTGAVARAESTLAAEPRNVERIIALGLAQSAVRQYREAIQTFSRGLAIAPSNPLLYRWRGHRHLSVREYDAAERDLAAGSRLDTASYDIWYHLGVLRFVRGDFGGAADAFARCQQRAPNANELVGATDWLWMSLARAGRPADARAALAALSDTVRATPGQAYARRIELYRGAITPELVITPADTSDITVATLAFGVGNWYLVQRDTTAARHWFARAVASGGWPAFGFMAAEAELRRLRE